MTASYCFGGVTFTFSFNGRGKKEVKIPVMAANLIRSPEQTEWQIAEGTQDFVAMGRPHLADPQWTRKVREGRELDIKRCIGCLWCFESMIGNAYVGRAGECAVNPEMGQKAVKLFFDNIEAVYTNGSDLKARQNMLMASYDAGIAFTRAYVGYVHAIAHALGGFYGIAHGFANAVLLPHVLEYYGSSVYKPLAELADLIGVGRASDTNERKAKNFIQAIKQLNEKMAIPKAFDCIKNADIPIMVERAFKEANPLYPVPKILSRTDLLAIFQIIRA